MLSWIGLGTSGSNGIPYEAGAAISCGGSVDYWSLHEGTKKDDGMGSTSSNLSNKDDGFNSVTLFTFDKTNKAQAPKLPLVKQGWSRLRTMKHPELTFVDGTESDETIVIATEAAIPLDVWMKNHVAVVNQESSHDEQRNISIDEVIWGFKCVLDALHFTYKMQLCSWLLSPFQYLCVPMVIGN